MPNKSINSDSQKRRLALLLAAGYPVLNVRRALRAYIQEMPTA